MLGNLGWGQICHIPNFSLFWALGRDRCGFKNWVERVVGRQCEKHRGNIPDEQSYLNEQSTYLNEPSTLFIPKRWG